MARKKFTPSMGLAITLSHGSFTLNPLHPASRKKRHVMDSLAKSKLVYRRRPKVDYVEYWIPEHIREAAILAMNELKEKGQ